MKILLKIESFALFSLSVYLFGQLDFDWWWFPILFLFPDLGMIGYVRSNKIGAYVYNIVHHQALAISLYIFGGFLGNEIIQLIGVILLAHSSLDRVFDYGFKYNDDFKHTHLTYTNIP